MADFCECLDEAMKLALNLADIRAGKTWERGIALGRVNYLESHRCLTAIATATIRGGIERGSQFDLNTAMATLRSSSIKKCRAMGTPLTNGSGNPSSFTGGQKEKLETAMFLSGDREQQKRLLSSLADELEKRSQSLYYVMGAGRRIFDKREYGYRIIGVTTTLKTTVSPKEARTLARKIIRQQGLAVRLELPSAGLMKEGV